MGHRAGRGAVVPIACGLGSVKPQARHVGPGALSSLLWGLSSDTHNRVPFRQGCQMALVPGRKAALLGQLSLFLLRLVALASASGIKARQPLILG